MSAPATPQGSLTDISTPLGALLADRRTSIYGTPREWTGSPRTSFASTVSPRESFSSPPLASSNRRPSKLSMVSSSSSLIGTPEVKMEVSPPETRAGTPMDHFTRRGTFTKSRASSPLCALLKQATRDTASAPPKTASPQTSAFGQSPQQSKTIRSRHYS